MKEMGGGRSESDKERTKLRERQRRAITTKIFHGLRKHGGYHLSARADINEVLRELAKEAGWVVEPDGTTYRSNFAANSCPMCGATRTSSTPTPTSSTVIGGGGECSTTASPRHIPVALEDPIPFNIGNFSDSIIPLATYMYGAGASSRPHNLHSTLAADSTVGSGSEGISTLVAAAAADYQLQQYPQQASRRSTPIGSQMRHAN